MLAIPSRTFTSFFGRALYHQNVIDHFNNPQNMGSLNASESNVGTGLVGAPACGDTLRLQIQVDPSTSRIKDVRFKAFGCPSAIASSSYVTTILKGKTLDEALKIENTAIASELKLPPVKLHCSTLAQEAVQAAVQNLIEKQRGPTTS
jgi:nitrogen fixation NifU-like protein